MYPSHIAHSWTQIAVQTNMILAPDTPNNHTNLQPCIPSLRPKLFSLMYNLLTTPYKAWKTPQNATATNSPPYIHALKRYPKILDFTSIKWQWDFTIMHMNRYWHTLPLAVHPSTNRLCPCWPLLPRPKYKTCKIIAPIQKMSNKI